jgi:hypothetical protein
MIRLRFFMFCLMLCPLLVFGQNKQKAATSKSSRPQLAKKQAPAGPSHDDKAPKCGRNSCQYLCRSVDGDGGHYCCFKLADTQFSIKVSVNDVWGAMTIGFIAFFVGNKLIEQLASTVKN